jgi:hypothetical protein
MPDKTRREKIAAVQRHEVNLYIDQLIRLQQEGDWERFDAAASRLHSYDPFPILYVLCSRVNMYEEVVIRMLQMLAQLAHAKASATTEEPDADGPATPSS